MQKQIVWILFLLASVSVVRSANSYDAWYAGARPYGYGAGMAYGAYGGYGGYGYGNWGGQTAFSANAAGMGQLVGAAGQYNKATAQAEAELQQARSTYIDNNKKAYQYRLEMQDETRKRNAQRDRNEKADQARGEKFASASRTPPLASDEYNPATGAIQWPDTLGTADYADLRTSIEALFAKSAKTGMTEELSVQIRGKVGEMKDLLRRQITDMPLTIYTASRRFLDRMEASAH